jgi:hypothetical protein
MAAIYPFPSYIAAAAILYKEALLFPFLFIFNIPPAGLVYFLRKQLLPLARFASFFFKQTQGVAQG